MSRHPCFECGGVNGHYGNCPNDDGEYLEFDLDEGADAAYEEWADSTLAEEPYTDPDDFDSFDDLEPLTGTEF